MTFCVKCGYPGTEPIFGCLSCGHIVRASRTQKGRGIEILRQEFGHQALRLIGIVQTAADIEILKNHTTKFPMFVRPAPSVPRHGYIDSRVVTTVEEVASLLKEVLADDPKGELLLCSFIKSTHSSIWTPGSLTVGTGHDGATAGKDTVVFPLVGKSPNLTASALQKAKISSDSWPFLEVVYAANGPIYTQLREGPVMPIMGNFVPALTEVKRVIHADPKKFQDLGWETEINNAKGEPGVVVWHPGGSLCDHFSIHTFTANIPIIFDKVSPEVGSILEPTVGADISFDANALLRGFVAGTKMTLTQSDRSPVEASLVALHNTTAMTGENAKWIGFAAAVLLRFGVAALNGEIRHFQGDHGSAKPQREAVYAEALKKNLHYHKARVKRLVNIFRYGKWHSSGFGGPKWACCGAGAIDVFNAVWNCANNPTDESARAVIEAVNLMVNQAHNGGWWFNKFVSQHSFDMAATGDMHQVIKCGPTLYKAGMIADRMKELSMTTAINRIAKWGRISLSPPKASSAKILYHPNINALEITISARLLGSKFKPLKAAITKLSSSDVKLLKNNLYLVEGDDGYRLELRKENPVVIWQDESLHEKSLEAAKTLGKK